MVRTKNFAWIASRRAAEHAETVAPVVNASVNERISLHHQLASDNEPGKHLQPYLAGPARRALPVHFRVRGGDQAHHIERREAEVAITLAIAVAWLNPLDS